MANTLVTFILSNLRKVRFDTILLAKSVMTTPPFRAEEALEKLKTNPHYNKYAEKILQLQKTQPDELFQQLEKVYHKKSKPAEVKVEERPFSKAMEAKVGTNPKNDATCIKRKALHDLMRTELVLNKSSEEIKQIWEEYHNNKDVISATIPTEQYYRITLRSKQFPLFLFPLPRGQGYEYILCQFTGNEVYFTPLISYQVHKENALVCLTLVHYTELGDKGVILMHGEYNKDILNVTEALCLANQLQLYYCTPDEKRMKLLERFTLTPDQFQHIDLIAELECLSI